MNTLPTVFDFNSTAVRVVADDHGEPWFNANDVCTILGYVNPRRTIQLHCRVKGVTKRYTPSESGDQEMTFINEGNLYRLIVKSRKPEAEAFEIKVMEEILPSIRKTGKYEIPGTQKALPGKLTAASQDLIKAAVRARVESLSKEKWGGASVAIWSAIGTKFGTRGIKDGYKNIPEDALSEIMSLVARTPLTGEYIGKDDAAVDAETEPKKIAPPVISEYMQTHINRKTHEIALGQYDAIRGIITDAVQSNLNCGATEASAHDYVDIYGDAASEVIVMNKRDVFMLASQTAQLLNSAGNALETIHHLEKHLGRNLYQRTRRGEHGCYGLPESIVESVINAAQERKAA